jgi:hypothetical protein
MTLLACTCAQPLIAGTAITVTVDGIELDNRPPVCVRCYLREREAGSATPTRPLPRHTHLPTQAPIP